MVYIRDYSDFLPLYFLPKKNCNEGASKSFWNGLDKYQSFAAFLTQSNHTCFCPGSTVEGCKLTWWWGGWQLPTVLWNGWRGDCKAAIIVKMPSLFYLHFSLSLPLNWLMVGRLSSPIQGTWGVEVSRTNISSSRIDLRTTIPKARGVWKDSLPNVRELTEGRRERGKKCADKIETLAATHPK